MILPSNIFRYQRDLLADPVTKGIKKYRERIGEIKREYEEGRMNFLEYQAVGFMAIDEITKKVKRDAKILRYILLNDWMYSDPLIYDLEKHEVGSATEMIEAKLKWIGKILVNEFKKKRY
jgi:hypothetical protein